MKVPTLGSHAKGKNLRSEMNLEKEKRSEIVILVPSLHQTEKSRLSSPHRKKYNLGIILLSAPPTPLGPPSLPTFAGEVSKIGGRTLEESR